MHRADLAGKATALNVSINTTITPPSRGLMVNISGGGIALINVVMAEDGTTILLPLVSGVIHPLEVKAVYVSGTTATTAIYFR